MTGQRSTEAIQHSSLSITGFGHLTNVGKANNIQFEVHVVIAVVYYLGLDERTSKHHIKN